MSLPLADNEKGMFVVISDIELRKESMQEFRKWFERSNKVVASFDGFVARKLLESPEGQHRIIVMFRDRESFSKMHQTPVHAGLHNEAVGYMTRPPRPSFYSVVAQ